MTEAGRYVFDIEGGHFVEAEYTLHTEVSSADGQVVEMVIKLKMALAADEIVSAEVAGMLSRKLAVRQAVHRCGAMVKRGEYERALAGLQEVASTEFHDEGVRLAMASVHLIRRNWEEAENALKEELRRFPDSLRALTLLQTVYERSRQEEKARDVSRKIGDVTRRAIGR